MEKELLQALKNLVEVKDEILGHVEFCRDGLSDDYAYLFEDAERAINKAEPKVMEDELM